MMSVKLEAEYRLALRNLLQSAGKIVAVNEAKRERYPHTPELWVSDYSWEDLEAQAHVHTPTAVELQNWEEASTYFGSCPLQIPEGVLLEEISYTEFGGTFAEAETSVGLNGYGGPAGSPASITCSCGLQQGLTVRWEGSFQAALSAVLGRDSNRMSFQL